MRVRIALLISLCALLMVSAVAGAGERMVLQAEPKVAQAAQDDPCDIFYVCSYWHEISPNYCTVWHVIYCGPIIEAAGTNDLEKAILGRQLTIETNSEVRNVKISRVAPQYHLASGAVVEPQGDWNPQDAGGELWGEIRPNAKRSYRVANWEDNNGDGVVGVGDRVVFDNGSRSRIKAVRFGVHADVLEMRRIRPRSKLRARRRHRTAPQEIADSRPPEDGRAGTERVNEDRRGRILRSRGVAPARRHRRRSQGTRAAATPC